MRADCVERGNLPAETEKCRYIILWRWMNEGVFGRVGRGSAAARVGRTIDGIGEIVEGSSRRVRKRYLVEMGIVDGGERFRVRAR